MKKNLKFIAELDERMSATTSAGAQFFSTDSIRGQIGASNTGLREVLLKQGSTVWLQSSRV